MVELISDFRHFTFLQYGLLVGWIAAIACGVIGSYVTVRNLSYIAGAIAHCTLGGMGMARYLEVECGVSWLTPMMGAVCAALIAALVIAAAQRKGRQDTTLSFIWSVGMGIGLLFISQTRGYNEELMSYLFGDILMVSSQDLWLVAGLDLVLLVTVFLFHSRFQAIGFDEDFVRLSGVSVALYNTIFLCLVALTVVLLVQVVGLLLVVALLTLPAAAASRLTGHFIKMMGLAVLFCGLSTSGGLILSYQLDFPAGAVVIMVAAGIYLGSGLTKIGWKKSLNQGCDCGPEIKVKSG